MASYSFELAFFCLTSIDWLMAFRLVLDTMLILKGQCHPGCPHSYLLDCCEGCAVVVLSTWGVFLRCSDLRSLGNFYTGEHLHRLPYWFCCWHIISCSPFQSWTPGPPSKCWDYSYVVLGMEPRAFCILVKDSTTCTISLLQPPVLHFLDSPLLYVSETFFPWILYLCNMYLFIH